MISDENQCRWFYADTCTSFITSGAAVATAANEIGSLVGRGSGGGACGVSEEWSGMAISYEKNVNDPCAFNGDKTRTLADRGESLSDLASWRVGRGAACRT